MHSVQIIVLHSTQASVESGSSQRSQEWGGAGWLGPPPAAEFEAFIAQVLVKRNTELAIHTDSKPYFLDPKIVQAWG